MAEGLLSAPMEVVAQIMDSSNVALLARLDADVGSGARLHAIYKPISGEQPLWDFPDGQLAFREVGAYVVARAGGWGHIPPTVLRVHAPFGPGSVQQWVGATPDLQRYPAPTKTTETAATGASREGVDVTGSADAFIRLWPQDRVPPNWHQVMQGEDRRGRPVVLAHADDPVLRSIAVLDAVLNNSDRKGSHILSGPRRRMHCIDHGLTLHHDDKLRTVLWGWAGGPLPAAEVARLTRLAQRLAGSAEADILSELLTDTEVLALRERVERLLATGRHPRPASGWPSVPWPPL